MTSHTVASTVPEPVAMPSGNAGVVPFHEPGLDELLAANLATGRLRFTTDHAQAARFADVHFLCVGTPQRGGGLAADLSYVEAR